MPRKNKVKWIAMSIIGVLLLAVLAAWLGDRKLKGLGHPGLPTFFRQVSVNYPKSFAVEPEVLEIIVKEGDLAHIEKVVADARARGVIIPEGNHYVPAEIITAEGSFKAKIRIKGKLTDHVKGSKWSFRVVAKKNGGFLGMRRFSLQHPGTRNYLYDWFYHQLMKGEGVIALNYGFIRLRFNEEDLGIYAYEEHFGPELLEHEQRHAGPIFRFDPSLYWEHRLNEMNKLRLEEPYAEYQAAAVDAFRSSDIAADDEQRRQFEEAVGLVDAFRRGTRTASQVFDADKIALRHAILDLIGGHHSMDFSDVKFYYDPVLKRVEPVSYESFSAFPIRKLAGSYRYSGRIHQGQDLHDAYFNDPEVFRAYVHHLERISRTSYLDSCFTALGPGLDSASAIVYQEFPWKEMDRSIFYGNQKVIRRLLDVPKGFHAFAQGKSGDTLSIMAVPIEGLPLEVHGLRTASDEFLEPVEPVIVPSRAPGTMGMPVMLKFLVNDTGDLPITDMLLRYSVLGASVQRDLEVFPFALLDQADLPLVSGNVDLLSFPFIQVDEERKMITFKPGAHIVDRDLIIPGGYHIQCFSPLWIDLRNGARIISRSAFSIKGSVDDPVRISSTDGGGGGIAIIGTMERSDWDHVELDGSQMSGSEGDLIVFQDADVRMRNCKLGGEANRVLLKFVRANAQLRSCELAGGLKQISSSFSKLDLINVQAYTAGTDAMVFHGGMISMQAVTIDNAAGTALRIDTHAEAELRNVTISNAGKGVDISEGSQLVWENGKIQSASVGVKVDKLSLRYGPVDADLNNVSIEAGEAELNVGEGNNVRSNGELVEQEKAALK